MSRPIILPLAAGALLGVGCGARDGAVPPAPGPGATEPTFNPPPPPPPEDPTDDEAGLQTYEELLRDRSLQQRTNPPTPSFHVAEDGRCYAVFTNSRYPAGPDGGSNSTSVRVKCPPKDADD